MPSRMRSASASPSRLRTDMAGATPARSARGTPQPLAPTLATAAPRGARLRRAALPSLTAALVLPSLAAAALVLGCGDHRSTPPALVCGGATAQPAVASAEELAALMRTGAAELHEGVLGFEPAGV